MPEGQQDTPPKKQKESGLARQRREANEERARQAKRRTLKFLATGVGVGLLTATGAAVKLGAFKDDNPGYSQENSQYPNLVNYYPEILNEKLHDKGEFKTSTRNVAWYNFSEQYDFDPRAAAEMYKYYEDLAKKGTDPTPLIINGKNTIAITRPRSAINDLVLFIADTKQKDAAWNPSTANYTHSFYSAIDLTGKTPDLTRIGVAAKDQDIKDPTHLKLYGNPERASQAAFSVEAFMTSVACGTPQESIVLLIQEILGNTIGEATAFKQAGFDYKDYSARVLNSYAVTNVGSGSFDHSPVAKSFYEKIPLLPVVLTKK